MTNFLFFLTFKKNPLMSPTRKPLWCRRREKPFDVADEKTPLMSPTRKPLWCRRRDKPFDVADTFMCVEMTLWRCKNSKNFQLRFAPPRICLQRNNPGRRELTASYELVERVIACENPPISGARQRAFIFLEENMFIFFSNFFYAISRNFTFEGAINYQNMRNLAGYNSFLYTKMI